MDLGYLRTTVQTYNPCHIMLAHNLKISVFKITVTLSSQMRAIIKAFIILGIMQAISSCSSDDTNDECKYLKALKQTETSFLTNENIKKLNADIRRQCLRNVFTVDGNCKRELLRAFGQQHNCS